MCSGATVVGRDTGREGPPPQKAAAPQHPPPAAVSERRPLAIECSVSVSSQESGFLRELPQVLNTGP